MDTFPTRNVIVTGSGRGIGRAIALKLAELGANVTINYHSNRQAADEVVAAIHNMPASAAPSKPARAIAVQADIGSAADRERLLGEANNAFGPVDLLVNNAGVAPKVRADMLDMTETSFDEVLGTNLKGPFFLSQLVARQMIARRAEFAASIIPAIVNISSISAFTASVNRAEYCIAKAGISMMTKVFAARLAELGILVYEIQPGVIETDMTSGVKEKYDDLIFNKGLTPIRRWGQPEDIAAAVGAISRNALPFSTGEVIHVDGGFHLHRL